VIIGTNNVDHGTGVYGNNSINVLMEMLGVPSSTIQWKNLIKAM
jgi:purine-nucleoside phosphorylase